MIFEAQQELLSSLAVSAGAETSGQVQASLVEAAPKQDGLSPLQRGLMQLLHIDASTHIDALIQQLEENSTSEVIAALCELELAGHIRQLPGKSYVRVW